jgi:hypothetical protein
MPRKSRLRRSLFWTGALFILACAALVAYFSIREGNTLFGVISLLNGLIFPIGLSYQHARENVETRKGSEKGPKEGARVN